MSLKKVILHIGLPKAGSSSLQVNYFRHLNDENHGYGGIWPRGNIGYTKFEMTEQEQEFANLVQPLWREYSRSCDPELLHKIALLVDKPVVVLSSEFTTSAYHMFCPLSVTDRLTKIRDYFNQEKIEVTFVLCFRDPIKMLVSQYYDHPFSSYKKNILGRKKVIDLEEWVNEQIKYNEQYIKTLIKSFYEEIQTIVNPYDLIIMNLDEVNSNWSNWIEKEHSKLELPKTLIPRGTYKPANFGVGERYVNICKINSYVPKTKVLIRSLGKQLSKFSIFQQSYLDERKQTLSKTTVDYLQNTLF